MIFAIYALVTVIAFVMLIRFAHKHKLYIERDIFGIETDQWERCVFMCLVLAAIWPLSSVVIFIGGVGSWASDALRKTLDKK